MNMKPLMFGVCSAISFALFGYHTTEVNGNTWRYEEYTYYVNGDYWNQVPGVRLVGDNDLSLPCCSVSEGSRWNSDFTELIIPTSLDGHYVVSIGSYAFNDGDSSLGYYTTDCIVPYGVREIEWGAFYNSRLQYISLPASLESIGSCAFECNCDLLSISVPDSVTHFDASVFSSCSALTTAKLPKNINAVPNGTFQYCSSLTSVTLPQAPERIGYDAFRDCTSLTSLDLPDSVKTIEERAFQGCSALTSIGLKEGLQEIRYDAFAGCSALTSVVLPEGLTGIGARAFKDCVSLTSIVIPKTVTSIGSQAFVGCPNLKTMTIDSENTTYHFENGCLMSSTGELVFVLDQNLSSLVLPEGVASLGEGAFAGMTNLVSVILPEGLTSLPARLFEGCSALKSVTIPSGIGTIPDSFAKGCVSLTDLNIPTTVTNIGTSAFANCASLSTLSLPVGMLRLGDSVFSGCTSLSEVALPEGLSNVGGSTFAGCTGLVQVNLPQSLTYLPNGFLSGCRSLTVFTVPVTVTTIGNSAFANCTSLETVDMPKTVGLGTAVFSGCVSLSDLQLPTNLTVVGAELLRNCKSLHTIEIPPTVTLIGYAAFAGCEKIEQLKLPNTCGFESREPSWTDYYWGMQTDTFAGCANLKQINLPDSLTTVKLGMFEGCVSLETIELPASVTNIEPIAFRGCTSLRSIDLSHISVFSEVSYIDSRNGFPYVQYGYWDYDSNAYNLTGVSGAFWGCTNLQKVVLPDEITVIKADLFHGCTALSEINWPSQLTEIKESAFEGCSGLAELVLPNRVQQLHDSAFANCAGLTRIEVPPALVKTSNNGYWYNSRSYLTGYKDVYVYETSSNEEAFRGCSGIEELVINKDILKKGVTKIFPNSKNIRKISYSEDVTSIPDSAFAGLSKLTDIDLSGVTSIGSSAFANCSALTGIVLPDGLTAIESAAFINCESLASVELPGGLTSIGSSAFANCGTLSKLTIPNSVTSIDMSAFSGTVLRSVVISEDNPYYRYVDGRIVSLANGAIIDSTAVEIRVLATKIREADPTILDVTYSIRSIYDKVDVRALAYEKGTRSWANVVRPETFVTTPAGGSSVIGDGVACNATNMLSWKVSADYTNNLAKLKVEIFVKPEALLPLDFMTLPASGNKLAIEFSYNELSDANVMNALMWLYADKDVGLSLNGGVLYDGKTALAKDSGVYIGGQYSWSSPVFNAREAAVDYVIRKMGYQRLTSANYLDYVNQETRLGLSPSGIRQYAVKEIAE